MATNIPPHNLGEVIDATIHLIDHPDATPDDLMQFVKGPDFPTGALHPRPPGHHGRLPDRPGLDQDAGRGRDRRGPRAASRIVVTELPYQTSVEVIEQKIADLVDAPASSTASASVRRRLGQPDSPASSSSLKRDANANVVLNNLYKHTPLQTSFGVNMVALVDGVPRTLNLVQALVALRRPPDRGHDPARPSSACARPEKRAHIVEGLLKAIDMLDAVIATIRASDDRPSAAHRAAWRRRSSSARSRPTTSST